MKKDSRRKGAKKLPSKASLLRNSAIATQRECVVCLDELRKSDNPLFLPCLHSFHADCVTDWVAAHTRWYDFVV